MRLFSLYGVRVSGLWVIAMGALGVLLFLSPLSAYMDDLLEGTDEETGPVGETDDGTQADPEEERIPGWKGLNEDTWGPAGRVEEYLPHEACDMCFTLPNHSPYTINEYVESDIDEGAVIIMREIPNPAPEIKERADYDPEIGGYYDPDTGERVWFIGNMAVIGPTDEEKWSPDLPVSTIEMKRIKARHLGRILSIRGVNSFGIGKSGFVVGVDPVFSENRALVPTDLEGIPVTVELEGVAILNGHENAYIRPIPAGVSVGRGPTQWGTLGPHVVRDTDTSDNGTCCEMLSLTAAHVLNLYNYAPSSVAGLPTYSPGKFAEPQYEMGEIGHVFQLQSCGGLLEDIGTGRLYPPPSCNVYSGNLVNNTLWRPDAGLLSYGTKSVPFNEPEGDEPTRRMQYRSTKDVRGPSGITMTAEVGDDHKVWGSVIGAHDTGEVTAVDRCRSFARFYYPGAPVFRYCGVNVMDYDTLSGDSGAMVAYKGEGHHRIAGMVVGGGTVGGTTEYVPASHIKEAFRRAGHAFSHYWGTDDDKWRPATDDGDD